MNIDLALEKIYSLKQFHVKLGLDNITHLLNHLDNPQNKFKSIHVAGSNGKGSTCSFLASIQQELGYKVGLYTSPHFVKFNERIRINGTEIDDDEIIYFLEKNKDYIDKYLPTFFEITTALAFDYFNKNNVDYAIIETGLGGRLDATNTIMPVASLITSISYEHSHILGDTLEKIAYEKAGILKKNIPTFLGVLTEVASKTIINIAKKNMSKCFQLSKILVELENGIDLKLKNKVFSFSKTALKGKHQLRNASLAIYVIDQLFEVNGYKIYQKGLDNVVHNSGIQGRYERYKGNNNIIFDAAHNLEGIQVFIEEFKKEYKKYNKCTLVFGAMRDKNIGEMLTWLEPYFSEINVTSTNYERAATSDEIKKIAEEISINVIVNDSPENIFNREFERDKNNCLVIIGSIYLIGEIKRKLRL